MNEAQAAATPTGQDPTAPQRPQILMADGVMDVNGFKIQMPPRPPEGTSLQVAYDILSLVGVAASVALVVSQFFVVLKKQP